MAASWQNQQNVTAKNQISLGIRLVISVHYPYEEILGP